MLYDEWGFKGSPFATTSLSPNALGEQLLVARETELIALTRRIGSGPKLTTVEGLNGVGKTSVVNVASYQMFRDYVNSGKGALVVPCRVLFQLESNLDTQEFEDYVLREVAQTLIEQAAYLVGGTGQLSVETLDRLNTWLNSPQIKGFEAGAFGFTMGRSIENNTSAGFDRSGFRKAVTEWLKEIFPNSEREGVICVLDNLELLQTSEQARSLLERFRDTLFAIHGLKWVLCGARGIIFGIASSPRLSGRLQAPVEIATIPDNAASAILQSRINTYRQTDDYYLPLTSRDFDVLYQVLNGNLRDVLSDADNYCQWVGDRVPPSTDEEKSSTFAHWLEERSKLAFESIEQEVKPRAMKAFKQAASIGASFSPGDFEVFEFNSAQAFRPSIQTLENAGLITSTTDDTDQRRKTIQITPKGWLVRHHIKTRITE